MRPGDHLINVSVATGLYWRLDRYSGHYIEPGVSC